MFVFLSNELLTFVLYCLCILYLLIIIKASTNKAHFFTCNTEIAEGVAPKHRFMSAYEQRIEPPDRRWQYLLFAAEPYETIAFKVSFDRLISDF